MSTRYEMGPCPACSAAAARLVADSSDIRDELEQLWSFHTRRVRPDTPAAQLQDRAAFSQQPPLRIVRCEACGLLYRNPREKADMVVETYRDEDPGTDAMQSLFENQRASYRTQARRLTRIFGGTGTGLEVGSYVGAFLTAAREADWAFRGIDVNARANVFARERGCDVSAGSIETLDEDARYDVIAFWNCFDQLPDPRAAALAARQRLRAGGLVAIRVPNGAFYARWRPRLRSPLRPLARTLLAHNNLLAFPYRHGFSAASLARLLAGAGFRLERAVGDTLVPVADRWTHGWARVEEQVIKAAMWPLSAERAPWLELYARAV